MWIKALVDSIELNAVCENHLQSHTHTYSTQPFRLFFSYTSISTSRHIRETPFQFYLSLTFEQIHRFPNWISFQLNSVSSIECKDVVHINCVYGARQKAVCRAVFNCFVITDCVMSCCVLSKRANEILVHSFRFIASNSTFRDEQWSRMCFSSNRVCRARL